MNIITLSLYVYHYITVPLDVGKIPNFIIDCNNFIVIRNLIFPLNFQINHDALDFLKFFYHIINIDILHLSTENLLQY
jgi:hypothetical protein